MILFYSVVPLGLACSPQKIMTATSHALIGASLAVKVSNPVLGIPLALGSHLVADLIPHWDAGTNHKNKTKLRLESEAAFDVLLGFALVFIIFRNLVDPVYLYSMVVFAQLPDWLTAPSSMFNFKVPPFSWADKTGHMLQSRMQLPWGLVTQIIVVGSLLLATVNVATVGNSLASLFRLS